MRKRIKWGEALLLMLPLVVLVVWGWAMTGSGQPLMLEKTLISKDTTPTTFCFTPASNNQCCRLPGMDTKVSLVFKYTSANLWKQFEAGPDVRAMRADLVDDSGKKYSFKLPGGVYLNPPDMSAIYNRNRRLTFNCCLPLAQVPLSAGRLTLKGKVVVDKGFTVPFSVVVREKKSEV